MCGMLKSIIHWDTSTLKYLLKSKQLGSGVDATFIITLLLITETITFDQFVRKTFFFFLFFLRQCSNQVLNT